MRVWPPPEDDPPGSSTQPFPAVSASGPPPAGVPSAQTPPPAQSPPPAPRKRKRGRTILLALVALLLLLLALAVPTVDNYFLHKRLQPDDVVHVVEAGQSYTFKHVTWRAQVEPMDPLLEGLEPAPKGRTWMQITVTRTAVDQEGARRSYEPEMELRDAQDRRWATEIIGNNVPPDLEDHQIGVGYHYTVIGIVPTSVADEVELYLRPSISRRGESVDEMFAPSEEDMRDVLRFKR